MSTKYQIHPQSRKIGLFSLVVAIGCWPQLLVSQTLEEEELIPPKLEKVSYDENGKPISVMEAFEPIRVADNTVNTVRRPRSNDDVPAILSAPATQRPVVFERRDNSPTGQYPAAAPTPHQTIQPPVLGPIPQQRQALPASFPNTRNTPQQANHEFRPTAPTNPMSVQRSAPKIDTQIELPGYINLNQPAKMRIKLLNAGESSAAAVKLMAQLPEHVRFIGSNPQPSKVEGNLYEFQLFDFAAKQTREIIIDMVPTEKKPIDIGTEIVIENAQRFTVSVREPKIKIALQGPTETKLGSNITHRVLLENIGDGIAENLSLDAIFPSQLRCAKKNNLVIPSLEPGQKVEVEMPSLVTGSGQTELSVNLSGVGIENQTVRSGIKIFQPELEISAVGPQINFLNREGIYSITLNNVGEIDATAVAIELKVPAGMKVTTISQQAKLDPQTGVLQWNFDRISPKAEQTIKFMTLATQQGTQDCVFIVRSKETKDKTIFLTTNVVTRAELNLTVQNQSGPVQVGGQAQFVVVVENTGSSKAQDITVQVELPDALTADKQDGIDVLSLGNNISFETKSLEPGQKREFRFTAIASEKGEHVVRTILRTTTSERQIASEGSIFVYEVNQSRVSDALAPAVVR